eukprot:TRINITY_DN25308_c0_g1_i1.p1 TRINITY_DN25308_c0_g1~~TRINITY_DN25308_c0_g1_i1.p1  ORF type:complete len:503 (+),score=116.76 TRINITY_DN25308_c0_g1_i1:88-1596(+)
MAEVKEDVLSLLKESSKQLQLVLEGKSEDTKVDVMKAKDLIESAAARYSAERDASRSSFVSALTFDSDQEISDPEAQSWAVGYSEVDKVAAAVFESQAAKLEQEALKSVVSSEQFDRRISGIKIPKLQQVFKSDAVTKQLESSKTLEFDSIAFSELPEVGGAPLCPLGAYLIVNKGLVAALRESGRVAEDEVFRQRILQYLVRIDMRYKDVPYHGAAHAADVMSTVGWLFSSEFISAELSALDWLMGLIAAAIHDVGHPGRNNAFMTNTESELALRYNDKSPLENMHAAIAFETMKADNDCNWFRQLSKAWTHPDRPGASEDLQHYVRRGIIEMVLGTDMVHHATCVKEVKDFVGKELASEEQLSSLDRTSFLMKIVLHTADISNAAKPQRIMLDWCYRVNQEFWEQGDEEKSLGLTVSQLCEREAGMKTVPKTQTGFISYVVAPLFRPIAELIPEAKEATDNLDKNLAYWEEMATKNAQFEDIWPSAKLVFSPKSRATVRR